MKKKSDKKEYGKKQVVYQLKEPAAGYKTTETENSLLNAALKKDLHKAIDTINDASFLKAVHVIIKDKLTQIEDDTFIGKPMSLDEFYARNARSQEEIRAGKLVSHKEVKKHFSLH